MAELMQFDLVAPERMLASFEASEIEIPGAEGDFTAMPDHAAVVTSMRPGILKATGKGDVQEYVVTGGFVEVTAHATSVLAEVAIERADMSRKILDGMIETAREKAAKATPQEKDAADKQVADVEGLAEILGL